MTIEFLGSIARTTFTDAGYCYACQSRPSALQKCMAEPIKLSLEALGFKVPYITQTLPENAFPHWRIY